MLTFGFYNSKGGDRKYDAEQLGAMFNGLITDGVFAHYKNALKVIPGDGNRELVISSGRAWFNGTWTEVDDNGHSIYLMGSAVETTYFVYIAVDKQARRNSIAWYSEIKYDRPDLDLYYYLLAQVTIPGGATKITDSMITDTRGSDLCPYVTGIMETVSFEEIVKRVCGDSWQDWLGVYEAGITTGVQNAVATSERALDEVKSMKAYAIESEAVSYIWAKFEAVPTGGGGFEWATDAVHTELTDPPMPMYLFRDLSYADLGPGFKPSISLRSPYIADGETGVKAIPAVTQSKVWKEYPYFWEGGGAFGTEVLRYDDLQRVIVNVGGTATEKYRYRVSRLTHIPVTYEPGAYIGTVSANNATAYPRDGHKDGYYYMRFAAKAEDVSFYCPGLSAKNVRDAIIEVVKTGGNGSGTHMSVVEVEELPSIGIKGVFYIVRKPGDSDGSEYLWLDRWEKIGGGTGQNADLSGYATEAWVRDGFQPKDNYLTAADIVDDLTTDRTDRPLSAAMGMELRNAQRNLEDNKLDASALPTAINTALAEAKKSGAFDGADGITPHIGANGNWWIGNTDTGVTAQGSGGTVTTETEIRDADAVRDAGRKPVKAMVSFMDDDCRKAVYHRKDTTPNEPSLWELIQDLGIPYTLACPPGSIHDPENPVDGNEEYLTVGELQEMHRGGVDISCHHWRQYNMDDTELLPTEADYDADLTRCLDKFRAWGITDVISVAYPQGVIMDDYLHVAKRHFRMGFGVKKAINQRPYASYRMDRCETFPRGDAYKADTTLALTEAKARVNDLAETGGWLIFMTHAWYETFSPADLRSLVAYIREQGIEIVGVNDAIRNTGNVVEVGDIVKPMEEQTAPFFVVDAEGNTYTNALHDYTPSGETLTEINVGYNLGYIGGENGTRMSSTDTNRWVSDDVKVQAGEIYRLTCSAVWTGAAYAVLTAASGGTVVDIVAGDANTPSTALTDHDITIPEGGTILRVSSNLTVQPEGYKIYRVESAEGSGSGASVTIDTTLTQSGQAADAKVVGDALKEKQPKGNYLTEAQLKTINGQSLVGEGNIETIGTSQSGKTSFDEFLDNIDVDYAYDSATGANYTVIRVYKNKLDGTKQYPFAVVPDVNEIKYSTLDFMEKFADDNGYLLAINSGLGSPATHQIDGIVVQNGVVVHNTPAVYHAGSMPLTIDVNGDLSYASSDADANELVANGVVSALCGFCPIIVDYNTVNPPTVSNVTHFTQNAQRQIIGQFGNGDYAIVTCEGRDFDNSDGWTIAEAQTICKKLGLKFAYNLDGGGSTQTVIGKKQLNTIYENEKGRKLPSFIVFNGKTELGVMPDVPDIPTKTLESITATYNGGSVAVGTDLTTLTGIVVTATYSDGSTAIVNGYTLSGEIVEGDNVITVKYSGKTTTITVVGVALSGFIWTIGTTEPNGTWFGQEGPEYHRAALYTTENTGSQVALDIDNNNVVNSHNVPYGAPKKLYLPKIPTGATKLSWSNSDANVLEAVWLYDATGTRITEVGTKYDMASPLDLTKYPNAVYWNCDCKYGTKNATIYANPDSSLPDAYARYQIICDTEFTFS